jgi:hemerythrin-like metal-binding protein
MEWSRTGLIEWTAAYSVGVAAIDQQHKGLIGQIRAFQEAMLEGRAAQSLDQILANLGAYTRVHFAFEEKLMEEHAYPETATHRAAHAGLTERVEELQAQLGAGNTVPSTQMMIFMRHWLTDHIVAVDKPLGGFLNLKGMR